MQGALSALCSCWKRDKRGTKGGSDGAKGRIDDGAIMHDNSMYGRQSGAGGALAEFDDVDLGDRSVEMSAQ